MRIAQLVKGENFGLSTFPNGGGLLNDPSSLSIKTKLGANDGIRSTKAFLTSVTPHKEANGDIFGGDISPAPDSVKNSKSRKVFGANAYIERQKKLGLSRNISPGPSNQTTL